MNLRIKSALGFAVLLATGLQASAQKKDYSWTNLPKAARPVFKRDTFNITKYGAKADGITLNTKSINSAINACSAKGGGVVLIPAGLWMTGPVIMKSNVNLHLDRAALLQFTTDKTQYKLIEGNYEGHPSPRNESPISGVNLTNIAITGDGIIDGGGQVWRAIGKDRLTESEWKAFVSSGGVVTANGKTWLPSESYAKGLETKDASYLKPGQSLSEFEPMKDFFRPNMVVFTNCKKVLLSGATIQNSPAWNLHMLLCEDLTFSGVRVRNPWNAQNGDGMDIESCRNVVVENCTLDCGDDGITIKSGRDEAGRKRGKPTENMHVRNNVVYRAHGGFVIGSEMSGGARNLFVENCTFIGTDIGLRFKTTRGRGGIVEKIYIRNIAMKDILGSAILFDMYYGGKSVSEGEGADKEDAKLLPVTAATPQFRDFHVSNVTCNGAAQGLHIRGLPEMSIKDIHLDNIVLKANKGGEISEAENITLKNVTFETTETKPVLVVENARNITFDGLKVTNGTEQVFGVTGKRNAQIVIKNADLSNAKKQADFSKGADKNVITFSK